MGVVVIMEKDGCTVVMWMSVDFEVSIEKCRRKSIDGKRWMG